jgi:hypothetical protein
LIWQPHCPIPTPNDHSSPIWYGRHCLCILKEIALIHYIWRII